MGAPPSLLRALLSELKRRHVVHVAAVYAVVGWLVIQVAATILPHLNAPGWVVPTIIVLVALGFPLALVLAWAFEVTPEGVQRATPLTAVSEPEAEAEASPSDATFRRWTAARIATLGGTVVLALAGASFVLFGGRGPAGDTAARGLVPDRVVVDVFENRTGDPSLDQLGYMAADWVTQGLARTGLVEVVPTTVSMHYLQAVKAGEAGTVGGRGRIHGLAEETRAGITVSGAYYLRGDTIEVQAEITDARLGRILQSVEPARAAVDEPLGAVERLRQRVMAALAVHHNPKFYGSVETWGVPPSFEAYQEWAEGTEAALRSDFERALSHFTRAAELDSTFLTASLWASISLINLGEHAIADSLLRRVAGSRERLTPGQLRFYHWQRAMLGGDLAEILRTTGERAKYEVGSGIGHFDLTWTLLRLNRPAEALDTLLLVDPDRGLMRGSHWYWNLHTALHHTLGEHEKELEAAREGRGRHPDRIATLAYEVRALAALERVDEVMARLDKSLTLRTRGRQSPGDVMLWDAALELRAHGRPEAAREALGRALDWYRGQPEPVQRTTEHRYDLAEALYYAGQWEEARALFRELAAEDPDEPNYRGYLGVIAARRGEREAAERIGRELAGLESPYLHGDHTYWRARIAAVLGERERAVLLLSQAHAQGRGYGLYLHRELDFESLRDYPPFQEFLRPKA